MTTQTKHLTPNGYVEIATGPCVATPVDAVKMRVHVGTVAPAADTVDFHPTANLAYSGAEKVYARAIDGSLDVVVTEVR